MSLNYNNIFVKSITLIGGFKATSFDLEFINHFCKFLKTFLIKNSTS